MKKYDFDEIVDRRNTDSIKYDALKEFLGTDGVQPLWVADMDFRTPDFIMEALRKRFNHEVLGYQIHGDSFYKPIVEWVGRRHSWDVKREWLSFSPGVVSALTVAVMAFTAPGDKVIVQPPVYFPFFESVRGSYRRVVENPLKLENGRYHFDFEDLERKIDEKTKLLFLCNPHNPGGMVWSREELTKLWEICQKHGIFVVSDEIHCDLLFSGKKHIPFASISEEAAQNCMVCMAPSKTFNLSGLSTSFVVIPNEDYMKKYKRLAGTLHINLGNIAGTVALTAAFTHGDEWLDQLMEYIEGNYNFLKAFFMEKLPLVKLIQPEATFLVWLDFKAYNMSDQKLNEFILEKAKVGLNRGGMFGTGGEGFMRINIACPLSELQKACYQIYNAFKDLNT